MQAFLGGEPASGTSEKRAQLQSAPEAALIDSHTREQTLLRKQGLEMLSRAK